MMRANPPRRSAGFSLIEVAVALAISVVVILGALALFDFNNKLARAQTHIAEMQNVLRGGQLELVRMVRMTGRGGLRPGPGAAAADTDQIDLTALQVRDNVVDGTEIAPGFTDSPTVVAGTDVLAIRGVFNTPIYQVSSVEPAAFVLFDVANNPVGDPALADHGYVEVCEITSTGIAQTLDPLAEAADADRPEALVMISPLDDSIYAVVALDPDNTTDLPTVCPPGVAGMQVAFDLTGTYAAAYRTLSAEPAAALPSALTSVAYLGLLEEYRYYVEDARLVPGDATSPSLERLSRARVYPATDEAWDGEVENLRQTVVDDIIDLQVALGIDSDNDGQVVDAGNAVDDWLFNAAPGGTADDATESRWQIVPGSIPVRRSQLFYVRVSTLARTSRPEAYYSGPQVADVENHDYNATSPINVGDGLRFHRRLLQTLVDLRNI